MRRMVKIFENVIDIIEITLILLIVGVVCLQIITRTFFGMPLSFPEEMASFTFISVVFISLAIIERHDGHLKVDFFTEKFGSKARMAINIAGKLSTLCIVVGILVGELQLFPRIRVLKTHASGIPYAWLHGIIILFSVLWGIAIIGKTIMLFRKKE